MYKIKINVQSPATDFYQSLYYNIYSFNEHDFVSVLENGKKR